MKNIRGRIFGKIKYYKHCFLRTARYQLTRSVIHYLDQTDVNIPIEEKLSIKEYLSNNLISQINGSFINEYLYRPIKVHLDTIKCLHYVMHNDYKLYFKRGLNESEIRNLYNNLCIEQDERSPHSYSLMKREYTDSDVLVDAGAAEGIWGLGFVEKISKLYLFECDDEWVEALQATYAPWKDKVYIINKFVSDEDENNCVALDSFFYSLNVFPTVIKADVEGAEPLLVKGSLNMMSEGKIREMILCTYHNNTDFEVLNSMLQKLDFLTYSSTGYMVLIYSGTNYSVDIQNIFRKGVVVGCRKKDI